MLAVTCVPKVQALSNALGALQAAVLDDTRTGAFAFTTTHPFVVKLLAVNTEFDVLRAGLSLTSGVPLCEDAKYAAFYAKVQALGVEYNTLTKKADPIAPYASTAAPPEDAFSILTLAKWGLIIGIGYIAYKWITAAAHASDDYLPRSSAPRYAGGTRRLT